MVYLAIIGKVSYDLGTIKKADKRGQAGADEATGKHESEKRRDRVRDV